jgi:hypothetical protein
MEIITPTNQTATINHSENRIFDFNDVNSRFYLGRTSNSLMRVFGDHVIDNLTVTSSIDESSIATFQISPGSCILDSTILQFNDSSEISMDLSTLNTNGKILITIDYSYIYTTNRNLARIGCYYWLNDTIPDAQHFNSTKHIVLAMYNFTTSPNTISEIPNPVLNPIAVNINGITYYIRPLSNIDKRILNIINYTFN